MAWWSSIGDFFSGGGGDAVSTAGSLGLSDPSAVASIGQDIGGFGTGVLGGTTAGGLADAAGGIGSGGGATDLLGTGLNATNLSGGTGTPFSGGGVLGSGSMPTVGASMSAPAAMPTNLGGSPQQVNPMGVAADLTGGTTGGDQPYGVDANGMAPNGMPTPPPYVLPPQQGLADKAGGWLDDAGKFLSSPTGKLLGVGVAGAGLARNLLTPNNTAGVSQITAQAQQMATNGAIYSNYLATGTLPAGLQSAVDQASKDAITRIKSSYASRNIAPNSTMEAQDIARVQQNAVVAAAQMADNLLTQGVSMAGISAQLYQFLANLDEKQSASTGAAIGNLATSLSGGPTINIGGARVP